LIIHVLNEGWTYEIFDLYHRGFTFYLIVILARLTDNAYYCVKTPFNIDAT